MPDIANKDVGLVVLGEQPLVAETPESLLDDDTTPIDKFYHPQQRADSGGPNDPDKWTITIDGEVNNPLISRSAN